MRFQNAGFEPIAYSVLLEYLRPEPNRLEILVDFGQFANILISERSVCSGFRGVKT